MKKRLMVGALALTLALTSVMGGSPFQTANSENKVVAVASAAGQDIPTVKYKKTLTLGKPIKVTKFPCMKSGDKIVCSERGNSKVRVDYVNKALLIIPMDIGETTLHVTTTHHEISLKLTISDYYRRAKAPYFAPYDIAPGIKNGITNYSSICCIPKGTSKNKSFYLYCTGVKSAKKGVDTPALRFKLYNGDKKCVASVDTRSKGSKSKATTEFAKSNGTMTVNFSPSSLGISKEKYNSIKYIRYFKY